MLKNRIRVLRVVQRVWSVINSICVLIPLSYALYSYLHTRNISQPVNGTLQTPWPIHTKTWPTYMYFSVAAVSLIFHLVTLIAYCGGVRTANKANTFGSVFDWSVEGVNFAVWIAAVITYQMENNQNGVPNDLWGWSCSDAADNIQDAFKGTVNFSILCEGQVKSYISYIFHSLVLLC